MRRVQTVLAATMAVLAGGLMPRTAQASNDPFFDLQWGLEKIDAPAAWAKTTGRGVRIGIVDTGVDLEHEDLAGKVIEGTSCLGSAGDQAKCGGSAQDDQGHGTHVSGIAAAPRDNARGVAGVAPDAGLLVAKVLNSSGAGDLDDVTAGIKWVVDHGARVVNLSLGDPAMVITGLVGSGNSLKDGIDYAWSHGAIPVVAAGNENLLGLGLEGSSYGDQNAIIVGATGPDDRPTAYSTSTGGAKWAVVAPGGAGDGTEEHDIYSTYWEKDKANQYRYLAGTSMAAPHVSGAVALLLAQGYTQQGAVDRLLTSADHHVACGTGASTCQGRIDVARATGLEPVLSAEGAAEAASATGSRPYGLKVPPAYDEQRPTPLVVLLHGYSSNGAQQDAYFKLSGLADRETFLLAYPDGTIDRLGNRFWNATDACCDFFSTGVDDVAYLDAVIDEIGHRYNVDPARVYLVGHSNGAFMAHRFACDRPGRVAAIVTLAGMQWKDETRCAAPPAAAAPAPVSVLHVHGRADSVIRYEGGSTPMGIYPGAVETADTWGEKNGCTGSRTRTDRNLDLDSSVSGAETEVERYAGCGPGGVELWTIDGGGHIPAFNDGWAASIWDFMVGHPKAG